MNSLEIPDQIDIPTYEGQRYEIKVPDTLDLTERAMIALNALTRVWDSDRDYELFWKTKFNRKPPVLSHNDFRDSCLNLPPKFLESLPLMRLICGSAYNIDVDKKIMESSIHLIENDGLSYAPVNKHTWIYPEKPWRGESPDRPFADLWSEGRMILAICMWYQREKKLVWKRIVEKKIDRLLELAASKEDYYYFPKSQFKPNEKEPLAERASYEKSFDKPIVVAYRMGSVCHGASLYYRLSGYKPALELARGLAQWARGRVFDEDGRFLGFHFHHTTYAVIGVLEYALASKDVEMIEIVNRCYKYGKSLGDPISGFFPEAVPGSEWYLKRHINTHETCELADMLVLALKLTKAGVGDYWEDVDRYMRNMFVEGQMTSTDWVTKIPDDLIEELPVKPNENASNAAERSIGSWAGWAKLNDWWLPENGEGIMQCCTGNAARTLYYVWDSILGWEGGKVRINLLMNRASPWLDLNSYLPFEGKIVLHIKRAEVVAIRVPKWTEIDKVQCNVNGENKAFTYLKDYIEIAGLTPGDIATIEFPIKNKVLYKVIGDIPYKIAIKGNTIVEVDPKGTIYPLFERDHYKKDKAPKKLVRYFVSKETITW